MRRPLYWIIGFASLGLIMTATDLGNGRAESRFRDRAVPVQGQVLPSWDHGGYVPLAYRSPTTGREIRTRRYSATDEPDRVGPITLLVDPDDPSHMEFAPRYYTREQHLNLAAYWAVPLAAALLWWLSRHRRQRIARRLIGDGDPAYRMIGIPRSGRLVARTWRMDLYPLDAAEGARSIATVPIVGEPLVDGPRVVDVKGSPRAGGSVALRETESAMVVWPSGRALLASRATYRSDPPQRRLDARAPARWWLVLGGVACTVIAIVAAASWQIGDVTNRSVMADVTVQENLSDNEGDVAVSYVVAGSTVRTTTHLAGPQERSSTIRMRVDPEQPTRIWQDGLDPPGTDGGWAVAGPATIAALVAGWFVPMAFRRRRRSWPRRLADVAEPEDWYGLIVIGGRLWFGWPLGLGPIVPWQTPTSGMVRFESEALVLVHPQGQETRFPWDRHWAKVGPEPPAWWLHDAGWHAQLQWLGGWPMPPALAGLGRLALDLSARVAQSPDLRARLGTPDGARSVLDELRLGPSAGTS